MLMECVVKGVLLLWCGLLVVEAAPWHKLEVRHSQACGDRLADIMSLVCSGRGYNVPFRPERSSTRRFRRGIVEECCRKSCAPAMLELYCRADPAEEPSAVPIRKRSQSLESTEFHQMEDVPISKKITLETEASNIATQENKAETTTTTTTTTTKEGEENYKLLNLLAPPQKQNTRTSNNKLTPNDTTEEDFYKQSNYPPMRHKNHHHSMKQSYNRKASTKTKRAKNLSGESSQTFQIGLVKPYFAGRALASTRSNYAHHAALS